MVIIIVTEFVFFSFPSRQPLPPLPPIAQYPLTANPQIPNNELFLNSTVSTTTQTTCLSTIKPASSVASTTTPTGVVKPTPSIAVTHTQSIEREEKALISLSSRSKPTSPSKRKDIKKHLQHKSKHSALDRINRWEYEIGAVKQKFNVWWKNFVDDNKINNLCCWQTKRRRRWKVELMRKIYSWGFKGASISLWYEKCWALVCHKDLQKQDFEVGVIQVVIIWTN